MKRSLDVCQTNVICHSKGVEVLSYCLDRLEDRVLDMGRSDLGCTYFAMPYCG